MLTRSYEAGVSKRSAWIRLRDIGVFLPFGPPRPFPDDPIIGLSGYRPLVPVHLCSPSANGLSPGRPDRFVYRVPVNTGMTRTITSNVSVV